MMRRLIFSLLKESGNVYALAEEHPVAQVNVIQTPLAPRQPFLPIWLWWSEGEMSPIGLGIWTIGFQSLALFVELAEPLKCGTLLEEVR